MAEYHFIGGDGKSYGPYSAEQMRQFMSQNRLTSQSQVSIDGGKVYLAASNYPELMRVPEAPMGGTPDFGGVPQHMAINPFVVKSMVNGPAIFMIVLAVICILFGLLGLAFNLFLGGAGSIFPNIPPEISEALLQRGVIGIVQSAVSLIANIVILVGAIKMRKCQSYGLAMTASILCILLDWGCCCLGLGAGIWSVVVLSKPEVKAAFH